LYAAVSDELKKYGNYKIMHINDPVKYDSINSDVIKELCINNGAEVAIVPKVKYFKVGLVNMYFLTK